MTNPGSRIWFDKDKYWRVGSLSSSIGGTKNIYNLIIGLVEGEQLDLTKINEYDFIVIPAKNLKKEE